MNVLVLNSGSSSFKFQLIATDAARMMHGRDERLCRGQIEWGEDEGTVTIQSIKTPKRKFTAPLTEIAVALEYLARWLRESGLLDPSAAGIEAVGHRVVHGGELFRESALITNEVLKGIGDCIDLAPLHNQSNLKGILAARHVFGDDVPQVAAFDTAFHQSMPEHAYLYALPYHLYQRHRIRRFGFHGISHRFVSERYMAMHGLAREQTNIITLHLGNGCSATAIRGGRSFDTSMGMTPLEGLVMGTRSGDIDPAIIDVIVRKEAISGRQAESLLNTQSGLLGISGITNDMRVLVHEAKDRSDRRARLAIEIFCYRAKKYIGAFLAGMGGADALVFTGGIGENQPEIRAKICEGFEWAGLKLDQNRNRGQGAFEGRISTSDSRLHAFVIPTDEELLIARDTVHCVSGQASSESQELRTGTHG